MKSALLTFLLLPLLAFNQQVDMSIFNQMKARQIGPAGMSGRVTCIDVIEDQPNTIYIGTASGGIWKSTNGGTNWDAVADSMPTINIGAIAIQQSSPDVIWAGTGEGNPRNSQNSGYGLYRSLDAGRTWDLMGLEETRNIHRILIHPQDPNTVWVGAQGPAWGDNPNRGVYKTTDGGKTWSHVLKGTNGVGLADLVLDPNNPNKLICSMWEFRRKPWTFNSGGEGSAIMISVDGGENWKEITEDDGLPEGDMGRIGLAIASSNSNRVYALIEAKKNEVYRSDDGGYSWKAVSSENDIGNRPFYYSDIFVDPKNENRVYSLWSVVSASEDGGKNWSVIIPYRSVHPDHHALYIHPKDPSYIILGNDGGLSISRDRAQSWRFVTNLPLAQYYHINVDNELPYNVYGGMQDNGSWRGPAYEWSYQPIKNSSFRFLHGGDGFDVSPDPENANRYGYVMSQRGYLHRYDLKSSYSKSIRPTTSRDVPLRFNWNAPLAQDPHDPATIYYGSQFVHRSKDRGDSWEIISPDLTTNDTAKQHQVESGGLTIDATGAENYTTLLTINPSPKHSPTIWAGSDDGRLSLTINGGTNWQHLEDKLPDMPKGAWIPQIHPSGHDVNEAFVVVNDYRRNDWKPYLYHTTDLGKSWKRICDEDDFSGYCLSVVQDPVEPNLIFVGTENGLYVSFNHGEDWNHWTNGYPNVSTMDMKIQEREGDLIIGTFGRAAYVLDNLAPLRHLAANSVGQWDAWQLKMFDIPDAYMTYPDRPIGRSFGGADDHQGENRRMGARIYVYYDLPDSVKDSKKGKMRIRDSAGNLVRTADIELEDGINYLGWNLRGKRPRYANVEKPKKDKEYSGRPILPGEYSISIECGGKTTNGKVQVKMDPRIEVTTADLKTRQDRYDKAMKLMTEITKMCDQLRACQKSIEKVNSLLPEAKSAEKKEVKTLGKKVNEEIQAILDKTLGKKGQKGIIREQPTIIDKMYKTISAASSPLTGGEQAFNNHYNDVKKLFDVTKAEVDSFISSRWGEYKTKAGALNLDPFKN